MRPVSSDSDKFYLLRRNITNRSQVMKAWEDIFLGLKKWNVWFVLGWQDIRLRYRRSTLGPFWITLSMGITISGMALLYSYLFKTNLHDYFPYLAAGMIIWSFFSTVFIESTQIFVESSAYLKQIKLPFTIFILRLITRNTIIFFHNLIIVIPIIFYFHIQLTGAMFLLIPAFIITLISMFSYSTILAIVGARFRDVTQIVTSMIQVIFFITPVMWSAVLLNKHYEYIIYFNPFAHFLSLLREPLLGRFPTYSTWIICVSLMLIGLILCFWLMITLRKKIIYWI